ncbi:hypothetical protein AVEN_152793-1 [Araneus ventricosus]|uniref:Uncharacterized protein n=1 Tax=Araneus ventricosus TaxID=182803 RepID=A0A4Y2G168_ARAVE|nr:hypothetical protein AVEN_152793-1 [Araneus ventricosus]
MEFLVSFINRFTHGLYWDSLVILASRSEATRELFLDGSVILNRSQMTRTIPELAPASSNSHAAPAGGCLTDEGSQAHIHGGFSMESGFEPGTFRP